uniref:50S ribosomal protein L21, chloroplastic n=1 Tax=Ptilothamnion sphaericum TaxID=1498216 RepID=A0A4D6WXI8_9FLOR|nr:ribosomal protein L21 [Ptilothamnion sphaericum]QCI08347.1 ribosomal protein L21 [Ptilothamnion sphaericum]
MSYAIIDAGGQQLWIEVGKFYDVNYIPSQPGDIISLNRVLLLYRNGSVHIGNPCLSSTYVKIKVLRHLQGRKIIVFKMKPKKNMRLKKGHRRKLTRVLIQEIV